MTRQKTIQASSKGWRLLFVFFCLLISAGFIGSKLISLYVVDQQFLQSQGDARTLRGVVVPAYRGIIKDRHGEPLAVSAPVVTVWADPKQVNLEHKKFDVMARLLNYETAELRQKIAIKQKQGKRFIYLRRHLEPEMAANIRSLKMSGINVDRDYKRFYPAAEMVSHVIGFTNREGQGQEGLELSFNELLKATPGKQLVLKDHSRRAIKHIANKQSAKDGQSMDLTLDMRLQYLAYRELKNAVDAHKADSASLVMLDAKTGEILVMANYPSYNPNNGADRTQKYLRNRAVTDVFEPGSPIKSITAAAALMSGKYNLTTVVNTAPGHINVQGKMVRDNRNYGALDISGIIAKSSNVGIAKLALDLESGSLHHLLQNVGIGQPTSIGLPGERSGRLPYLQDKQMLSRVSLSYGYGLSVTPLQLAKAYLPLANDGLMPELSLIKQQEQAKPVRVMPSDVAQSIRMMMEAVVTKGTGQNAKIAGYRVAGKTGTVHKVGKNGYIDDQYQSVFVGIAPASDPKIVTAILVDNPKGQEHYGGEIAAPIFSRSVSGALRMLNVQPDNLPRDRSKQQMVTR